MGLLSSATVRYMLRAIMATFIVVLSGVSFMVAGAQSTNEKSLSLLQLHNMVKTGDILLIDVRTPGEYAQGYLEDAILIEYQNIASDIEKYAPNLDTKIALYCRSGRRSEIAAVHLRNIGYQNVVNLGGYDALKGAGYPTQKP